MDKFKLSYKPYGQNALLIEWPRMINESVLQDILRFKQLIAVDYPELEQIPAYNSLCLVARRPIDFEKLTAGIKAIYAKVLSFPSAVKKYGGFQCVMTWILESIWKNFLWKRKCQYGTLLTYIPSLFIRYIV